MGSDGLLPSSSIPPAAKIEATFGLGLRALPVEIVAEPELGVRTRGDEDGESIIDIIRECRLTVADPAGACAGGLLGGVNIAARLFAGAGASLIGFLRTVALRSGTIVSSDSDLSFPRLTTRRTLRFFACGPFGETWVGSSGVGTLAGVDVGVGTRGIPLATVGDEGREGATRGELIVGRETRLRLSMKVGPAPSMVMLLPSLRNRLKQLIR